MSMSWNARTARRSFSWRRVISEAISFSSSFFFLAGGVLDDLEPDGELALRGGGFPEVQGEPVERVVASLEPRITLALHDALNLLDSLLQAFELVVYLVHVGHADGHRRALERDVGDGLGL